MALKKILITGGSGMLGHSLIYYFSNNYNVAATYFTHDIFFKRVKKKRIDLLDKKSLAAFFKQIEPDYVIHTVALTDVDLCEKEPELACKYNVLSTENISDLSLQYNSKLIYISTDAVFDGKKGNYTEEDIPCPINTYGKTKFSGEKKVTRNKKNLVLRCDIYGWNPHYGLKKSLPEMIFYKLTKKEPVYLFTDHIITPIYTKTLAAYLEKVLHCEGVLNIGIDQALNKYQLGLKISKVFRLNDNLIKKSVSSEHPLTTVRPKNLSLNISKFKALLNSEPIDLIQDITNMKKDKNYWKN